MDHSPSTLSARLGASDKPGRIISGITAKSQATVASATSTEQLKVHHDRLKKMQELDGSTKIPFIMVELVGNGHKDGEIEICGKDEYGVYDSLEEFFMSQWHCVKLDPGDLRESTPLPFCDALYKWDGFLAKEDGTNNIGLATMRLVDFMCNTLSWTLGVINGGNVGKKGEIREVQVIFKAPHPMNLEAHHIMIELRSAGYIEVCGSHRGAKDKLHEHFVEKMKAVPIKGHQDFSDRYYEVKSGVFKERGRSGENNLGKLTVEVCDAVVKILPGWTLVTVNGGNYGEAGTHREQQLVFRWDNHPLGDSPHLMVEMREAGYIEVCGQDIESIYSKLTTFLEKKWGCSKAASAYGQEPFCDLKFKWKYKDMLDVSAELTGFFHELGWQMVVCSQGTVQVKGNAQSREQQVLFRPFASGDGVMEPHFFIEMYQGEGKPELYDAPDKTQTLGNQRIRIREVGDCRHATDKLAEFIIEYLGGGAAEESTGLDYYVDVFLSRGLVSNNMGCWTMRLCDFMVDRLGWSFVVCNVCNLGPYGQYREQQLAFRWDGERREMPVVKLDNNFLEELFFVGLKFPNYWKTPEVLSLMKPVGILSCTQEEIQAMQTVFDNTFERILTRDRVYEYQRKVDEEMPFRLEVVHMFRSEHAELYRKYMERYSEYSGGTRMKTKTQVSKRGKSMENLVLNKRLGEGESLLFHGTNPSSAMGIMKKGFVLKNAGKATGTMFGHGIYLAEACSKSDEYARDDNGGTYPGLLAMLVCRTLVGNPYVVQDAGEAVEAARAAGCDVVLGDRESRVGTYREFIFFDERQVLPEYTVIYKREYDPSKVPTEMRQAAKGTTGRNWQVRNDRGGWEDIPPNVSAELTKADENGLKEVDQMINGIQYRFNVVTKVREEKPNGTSRKIRPPMRR